MEVSIFLAKAWGLYLVITCLAFLVNRKTYQRLLNESQGLALFYVSGIIALIIGILSVLSHNIWTTDARFWITLLGWLVLLKGLFRVSFPQAVLRMAERTWKQSWVIYPTILFLILGIYLVYWGFRG